MNVFSDHMQTGNVSKHMKIKIKQHISESSWDFKRN